MKKKRTVLSRLLAGVLCALMILGVLPLSLVSFAEETTKKPPESLANLSQYHHGQTTVTDTYVDIDGRQGSGYGNPVTLHYYYDSAESYPGSETGKAGTVTILYVMNTNTTRYGTDSDETIVRSMLERGFYVVVMDYAENRIVSPDLEWSVQTIRTKILKGNIELPGRTADENDDVAINYVVPAGDNIVYGIPYFSYDKHGSAGTLERIVEIWNNDFRSVKRNAIVKWTDEKGDHKTTRPIEAGYDSWYLDPEGETGITGDRLRELRASDEESDLETAKKYCYTRIGNTWAMSVFDCVKADGSFIDLDLYADVIYPTGEQSDLPVMVLLSSSYTRASSWTSETRPQLTGFLFAGYAGVVSDYGLVPMARDDHYGYFSGNSQQFCVSGDNYTYSLSVYNGVKSDTALLRMIRKMGTDGVTLDGFGKLQFSFDPDAIGIYGNSKAGVCARLGNAHPELLEELRHFDSHNGETRREALDHPDIYGYNDPFVTDGATNDARIAYPEAQPYLTYADGTTIPSQANLVYAQCGAAWETITDGNAPIFSTGTQKPGGDGCSYDTFYRHVMNMARASNVPFYGLLCPEVGHNFGYGPDKYYGIDTYYAFLRYAKYWLQNGAPSCDIIDVDSTNDLGINMTREIDYIYEIGEDSAIRLQFIGQIGGEEIGKVEITDAATGEALTGEWTSSFGGQQWKFTPYEIKENTYYRVTVPTTLMAKNGQCIAEEKTILFRTTLGEGVDAVQMTSESGETYFLFENAKTETSYRTELRFTVSDKGARNTLVAEVASLAEGKSYDEIGEDEWESVGELIVLGAGIYTMDVTDVVKGRTGSLVFRLKEKYAAGAVGDGQTFGVDEDTDLSSLGYGWIERLVVASVDTKENEDVLRVDGFTRNSSFIDLDNKLNGNYVSNPYVFLNVTRGISSSALTESDYGRTFRVTFRIFDTTSRLIVVRMAQDSGNGAYDFNNTRRTYRTKANQWTTIDYVLTLDNLDACTNFDGRSLWIAAENKSVISLDPLAAPFPTGMANSDNQKPNIYAGTTGLAEDYDIYYNAMAAMADGKVSVRYAQPFYVSGITFTELHTSVALTGGRLVTHPQSEKLLSPTGAVSLDSTDPDATADGTLSVGGGVRGEDKTSKKTYLKLSLDDYIAGDVAYFSFKTSGAANTISVYGIADVSGEGWDPATVTARTAPASDVYTGGVLLSEVWNGMAIATVSATDGQTVTVDITEYAKEHKRAGAETLTLILTAKASDGHEISRIDFEGMSTAEMDSIWCVKPGYNKLTSDRVHTETENGTENSCYRIATAQKGNAAHFNGLFSETKPKSRSDHKLWTEADIGRTYRITFRAKTDGGAENTIRSIHFGMMSATSREDASTRTNGSKTCAEGIKGDDEKYCWEMYGQSADFAVDSEWQTYTYTFRVDENMLAKQLVQWTQAGNGTWSSVNATVEAISYFGVCPVATTYQQGVNVLYVDDIRSEEITGAVSSVSRIDFEGLTDAEKSNIYGVVAGHNKKTEQGCAEETADGVTNTVYRIATAQKGNAAHINGLFSETKPTSRSDHKLWTKDDIGRTYRITFRAKIDENANNSIQSFHVGMMSATSRADASTRTNGSRTCAEGITGDDKVYCWFMYAGSGEYAVTSEWQTYSYTFTVDENMLAKQLVKWTEAEDGSWSSVNATVEAISYFGICPVATNYNASNDILYVDDIRSEEIIGETFLTPIERVPATTHNVLDFNKLSSTAAVTSYAAQSGYSNGTTGTHAWAQDDERGQVFSFVTGRANATPHLTGMFKDSHSDIATWQNSWKVHKLWQAEDVGKTFRVTFTVKAGENITSLEYGMMSYRDRRFSYDTAAGGSSYKLAEDETGTPDDKDYSTTFYGQKHTTALTAGEWVTCTFTFTVDDRMLPLHVVTNPASGDPVDLKMQAISYLGIRPIATSYTAGDAASRTICIDKITVEELPSELPGGTLGTLDFDLAAYNTYISGGGYGSSDLVQGFATAEETGDVSALRFRPFRANNSLRFTGIFGTDPDAQTSNSVNRLWTEEDIGKTFRVTFRAKASTEYGGIPTISFGMMRGYCATYKNSPKGYATYTTDAETDDIDYAFNFYGTAGEGTFAEADRWYTFTYEFTVDKGMLPKAIYRLSDDSYVCDSAISYFGIQVTGYDYKGVNRGDDLTNRPTVYLDDITVREVNGFAGSTLGMSNTLAVSGEGTSETLGVLATPQEKRENRRYTVLPFVTDSVNSLTEAQLSFFLSGADGETLTLYLLKAIFPTFADVEKRLTAKLLTFTAKNGENLVDVTEAVRAYLGQKLTFVLVAEEASDPLTVTTPTLTIGTEKSDFDATAFQVKSNITLASDFLYHVYVPVISALTSLTLDGEALDLTTLPTKVIDGTLYYVVTKPIAPKDGTKAFTLKATVLADGETKTATYNLSIPTYAAKIVNNNATYNETTKTLMRDILSYISAAMTYFDTSTDEAQNTITEIVKEGYNSDLTAADVGLDKKDTANDSGNALSTVCLNLEATPSFIFYLEKGKESLADTFKFTSASGAPLTVTVKKETSGEKRTYLEVTTYAYAMGDLLTFTYTDEAGSQTGTYHLAAYYGGDTSDANLSPLLLRLAKYAKSASAYRDSVLGKPEGN